MCLEYGAKRAEIAPQSKYLQTAFHFVRMSHSVSLLSIRARVTWSHGQANRCFHDVHTLPEEGAILRSGRCCDSVHSPLPTLPHSRECLRDWEALRPHCTSLTSTTSCVPRRTTPSASSSLLLCTVRTQSLD